jgi:hypothetical protein
MRKMLFALAVMVMGFFAIGAGSPASAATAGAVTALNDVVTSNSATQNITYYRRGYCYYYPWRCRRHHYGYYRPYRRHWRHHHRHHRPWWW